MMLRIICKHLFSLFVVYVLIYLLVNAVYFFGLMEDRTFTTKSSSDMYDLLIKASYKNSNFIEPFDDKIKNIGEQLERKIPAASLYTTPEEIKIDQKKRVDYTISLEKSLSDLLHPFDDSIIQEGSYIKVSDIVQVKLHSSMFDIMNITSEKQAVSKMQNIKWSWELTPKTIGEHPIYLTVDIIVIVNGKEQELNTTLDERTIKVTATKKQMLTMFLEKHWQWLLAAIGGSFAWLWARKKQKREKT